MILIFPIVGFWKCYYVRMGSPKHNFPFFSISWLVVFYFFIFPFSPIFSLTIILKYTNNMWNKNKIRVTSCMVRHRNQLKKQRNGSNLLMTYLKTTVLQWRKKIKPEIPYLNYNQIEVRPSKRVWDQMQALFEFWSLLICWDIGSMMQGGDSKRNAIKCKALSSAEVLKHAVTWLHSNWYFT